MIAHVEFALLRNGPLSVPPGWIIRKYVPVAVPLEQLPAVMAKTPIKGDSVAAVAVGGDDVRWAWCRDFRWGWCRGATTGGAEVVVLAWLTVVLACSWMAPAAGANPPQATMAITTTPSFLKAAPANLSVVSKEARCHDAALNFPVRYHSPVKSLKGPPEISLVHVSVYFPDLAL